MKFTFLFSVKYALTFYKGSVYLLHFTVNIRQHFSELQYVRKIAKISQIWELSKEPNVTSFRLIWTVVRTRKKACNMQPGCGQSYRLLPSICQISVGKSNGRTEAEINLPVIINHKKRDIRRGPDNVLVEAWVKYHPVTFSFLNLL